MWIASNAFGRTSPCPYGAWISGAVAFWLAFGGLDGAQARKQKAQISIGRTAPSEKWTPVERWAWSQIEKGETADLNEHCRTPALDPKQEKDARWQDECRMLRGKFVTELLTKAPWREATPFAGVMLSGARIDGDVGLRNTKLVRSVAIMRCRIEGGVDLMRAQTESLIAVRGSLISGPIFADGLRSETDLLLGDGAIFKEWVSLNGAKVGGQVNMIGATLDGRLDAESLEVGGSLLMYSEGENKASFKDVNLNGAKVTGQVAMTGVTFDGKLNADSLGVGGSLYMNSKGENKASFKDVNLNGAKVTGQVAMAGATFDGRLDADSLEVGESLLMRSEDENKSRFKDVSLRGAKITGQVDMTGAAFDGELEAESLRVGSDVFMRDARCAKNINLVFAHIDGSLDLRGAQLADLDLWGASVNGNLLLGVGKNGSRTVWNGHLNLRNAHAGNLMDTTESWPANGLLSLDGFTFAHVGGRMQDEKKELERSMKWWDSWAKRDTEYSPTPYAQLAAALKNSGDAAAADDIRYLGRERARQTVCDKRQYLPCLLQSVLGFGVGYGIGVYTFFALGWVLFLSFVSMFILKLTVKEAKGGRKSWPWCLGASLSRLLPGVDLSKEFADFFDGPFRPRFNFWQGSWFWFTRFAGVVLGAALIAAIAGLTHGS